MNINFACSKCKKALFAQERFAGRKIKCPDCQTTQDIPDPFKESLFVEPKPPKPEVPKLVEEFLEEKPPEVPEVSVALESAGLSRCPECKKVIAEGAKYCRYCHTFLDPNMKAVVGRLKNTKPEEPVYASFWLRAAAFLIDWTLFGLFWTGLFSLSFLSVYTIMNGSNYIGVKIASGFWFALIYVLAHGLPLLFFGVLHGMGGQSIGKWWLGIRVVRRDNGDSLGLLLAFARSFGALLSLSLLGLGNCSLFFDRKKRTLQDFICDSIVIRD